MWSVIRCLGVFLIGHSIAWSELIDDAALHIDFSPRIYWVYADASLAIRDNEALGCFPNGQLRQAQDGTQRGFLCPEGREDHVIYYGYSDMN